MENFKKEKPPQPGQRNVDAARPTGRTAILGVADGIRRACGPPSVSDIRTFRARQHQPGPPCQDSSFGSTPSGSRIGDTLAL